MPSARLPESAQQTSYAQGSTARQLGSPKSLLTKVLKIEIFS